jgi:hypothetical protein
MVLPFVLYGCEIWSITLRSEYRLSRLKVLRRIFGPKREEVEGWRNLYNDDVHTRGCIQKFPDWPPGARTAHGTALCH